MTSTPHPNMFPGAGETVAIGQPEDEAPKAATAVVDVADHAEAAASAWANPAERLRRAVGTAPAAEPKAPEKSKEPRLSHSEKAIAHLRANGPSTAAELSAALGITSRGGITPFIGPALKHGDIVRDGRHYALPGQAPRAAASNAVEAVRSCYQPAPDKVPSSAAVTVEQSRAQPSEREPDFTLSAGGALLISWPDGSVTVQRGGASGELAPHHLKLFRIFVEMRT